MVSTGRVFVSPDGVPVPSALCRPEPQAGKSIAGSRRRARRLRFVISIVLSKMNIKSINGYGLHPFRRQD